MGDDVDGAVKRYESNKRAMIRELIRCIGDHQPTATDTRSVAEAVNEACRRFGYLSAANASMIAKRPLTEYEKKYLVPTEVRAAYFACAFALYGAGAWATTPEAAQYQVYCYCLFGAPTPPPGADTSRLDALPKTIKLERIRPAVAESAEEREAIAAQLRAATPEAVADYLLALSENIRRLGLQPVEEESPPPCDENCVMVSYLKLAGKASQPVNDEDRAALAEATGIPLPRVARLLCGDPWTAEERTAVEAYAGNSMFTLESLAAAVALSAKALSNANQNPKSLGTVGKSKNPA